MKSGLDAMPLFLLDDLLSKFSSTYISDNCRKFLNETHLLSNSFSKMLQFLQVCTYYKFWSRSSSHTKRKSWTSHQLKKNVRIVSLLFHFCRRKGKRKKEHNRYGQLETGLLCRQRLKKLRLFSPWYSIQKGHLRSR